jgi:outer membrane lipoprotein-sorting protein
VKRSEILGVPVIVSAGPAQVGTATTLDGTGHTTVTPTQSGVQRIYLDPERLFIMKLEREPNADAAGVTIEVTRLDVNVALPARIFIFSPPPGSHRDNRR